MIGTWPFVRDSAKHDPRWVLFVKGNLSVLIVLLARVPVGRSGRKEKDLFGEGGLGGMKTSEVWKHFGFEGCLFWAKEGGRDGGDEQGKARYPASRRVAHQAFTSPSALSAFLTSASINITASAQNGAMCSHVQPEETLHVSEVHG